MQPDVVHAQGWAYWADPRRWPAVLTIHGVPELDALYSERSLRRFRHLLIRVVEKRYRRRYRHIISISDYVNRRLKGQFLGRCHPIPNCVTDAFFDVPRAVVPHRALFVGSIIPLKNVEGLVQAARRVREAVPDFTLHLAGSPYRDAYLEAQRDRCRELGIENHVRFLGRLSREETCRELAAAQCFILPSFQENQPLALLEAMAAGVPAVAAAVGGVPELIEEGGSGFLVDPYRPDQIADRVIRVLADPDLARRLGDRAREKAQAHRKERVADRTVEVYREVDAEWKARGTRTAGGRA